LLPKGNNLQLACSADGRIACLPNPGGAIVLHRDSDHNKIVPLTPQEDVRYVSISADSHWVATGSHNNGQVKIWESATGTCRKILLNSRSGVQFVPGNRWLYTSGDDGQLWSVDSWEPGPARNHWRAPIHNINFVNCAFSPDGNLLAEGMGDGIIRITDVSKNCELANLQDPNRDDVEFLTFSADGTRLLTVAAGMQVLHVWDLEALDRGLREAGLAWQIPIVARPSSAGQPLNLQIDLGREEMK
jgi:WD40 repeat protein